MRLFALPLVFSVLLRYVFADIEFLTPTPGARVEAGVPLEVRWQDSGRTPLVSDLQNYVLTLYSGANASPVEVYTLWTGELDDALSVQVIVPKYISGEAENAYFVGMTSKARIGGTIENYSSRFTLTGMTGDFSSAAHTGLRNVKGTDGPLTINKLALEARAVGPDGVDAAAGAFGVPYVQQTGPTRYAPMQAVPGTKITATNTDPLYPTSSVDILSEALGLPTISTTVTQPPTAKFASHANTAAPASNPTDAMHRFLNRWKD